MHALITTQKQTEPCEKHAAAPFLLKAAFLSTSRTHILSAHSRSSNSLYCHSYLPGCRPQQVTYSEASGKGKFLRGKRRPRPRRCATRWHTYSRLTTQSLSQVAPRARCSHAHPTTTSQHIVLTRFVRISTCSPAQPICNAMPLSHLPAAHIIVTPTKQLPY